MFPVDSHWELQFTKPEEVQNLWKTTPVIGRLATGLWTDISKFHEAMRSISATAELLVVYCTVNGRLDVNVALNRPSYSTSVYAENFSPNYGNDGDKSNCHAANPPNSLVMTNYETNPWYVVDLGVPLLVAGIKLTNTDGRQPYGK